MKVQHTLLLSHLIHTRNRKWKLMLYWWLEWGHVTHSSLYPSLVDFQRKIKGEWYQLKVAPSLAFHLYKWNGFNVVWSSVFLPKIWYQPSILVPVPGPILALDWDGTGTVPSECRYSVPACLIFFKGLGFFLGFRP